MMGMVTLIKILMKGDDVDINDANQKHPPVCKDGSLHHPLFQPWSYGDHIIKGPHYKVDLNTIGTDNGKGAEH